MNNYELVFNHFYSKNRKFDSKLYFPSIGYSMMISLLLTSFHVTLFGLGGGGAFDALANFE